MSTSQPKLPELLASLKSVRMVSEVALSQGLVDPKPLFYSINRYAAMPSARRSLCEIQYEQDDWLKNCLRYIDLNNNCYLFVLNSTGGWYWTEVEAANHADWISELLVQRSIDDFMVLSHDGKGFIGFIEDEFDYLAFAAEDAAALTAQA